MNSSQAWLLGQLARAPDTRVTGYLGERLVLEELKDTRWRAYQPKARKMGDLLVTDTCTGEILKVEVKTANQRYGGYWQFLLQKNDAWGVTSIDHADIVMLLALDGSKIYPYVLPRKILAGRVKVKISSHPEKYKGQWAAFRQSWDALSLCASRLNELAAKFYGFDQVLYAVV